MLGFLRRARGVPPLDEAAWNRAVASLPFVAARSSEDLARLRALCARFLDSKTVTGVAGLAVDDEVRISIAVQACLPVLELGLGWYDDFVEIVVYPGTFRASRRRSDDAGVVHEWSDDLAGEAMEGGPVVLSWDDVSRAGETPRCNVVLHEFAHKLDMADGEADGCPPMPPVRARAFKQALDAAFDRFVRRVDAVEASLPSHIDPEGPEAQPWWDALPLDPYAATDPAEFFAVASEVFFVDPVTLAGAFPDLHRQLRAFYRQDP